MSADYWKQQIRRMEEKLVEAVPADLEHVSDGVTRAYDAEFVSGYTTTPELPVVDRAYVEAGTPAELKTCQVWIDDAGSGGGRRRGRWFVQRDTHDELASAGGVYVLLVTYGGEIVAGRVAPTDAVSRLASWTNGGKRYDSQRAYIPWAKVIDPGQVQV